MKQQPNLILASGSQFRSQLLNSAGLSFKIEPATIDERAVEETLQGSDICPADVAMVLAQSKAMDVCEKNPEAVIIGCDQTLEFEDGLLHKPSNMEEARRRLLKLSGKTHMLHSAIVLAKSNDILWQHTSSSSITFRQLSPEFVGRHLASVGEIALSSVGAYQIEGEGIQLFEKIEGDFFSILGLPLLPLLKALRKLDMIDG